MSESKVLSPIPGVFYRKPSPDEPDYVNEGDTVSVDQVIGLVEVMKSYYEIKAEADGVIEKFKVGNEASVDAGQEIAVIHMK